MKVSSLLKFVCLLLLMSCSRSLPELQGIDRDVWRSDHNGCSNKRTAYIESIREQRMKLKALSEMEIVDLLGRPDLNELSKRNQKFYYYYLQAGPLCPSGDSSALKLVVRFNATGLAREISVE